SISIGKKARWRNLRVCSDLPLEALKGRNPARFGICLAADPGRCSGLPNSAPWGFGVARKFEAPMGRNKFPPGYQTILLISPFQGLSLFANASRGGAPLCPWLSYDAPLGLQAKSNDLRNQFLRLCSKITCPFSDKLNSIESTMG